MAFSFIRFLFDDSDYIRCSHSNARPLILFYETKPFYSAQNYDILPTDILSAMKKDKYNVLAVYSLLFFACREHFSGILDAMSNTSN